nr:MAG TPA: hypothetical protein [Caudoviricetes sp.]
MSIFPCFSRRWLFFLSIVIHLLPLQSKFKTGT